MGEPEAHSNFEQLFLLFWIDSLHLYESYLRKFYLLHRMEKEACWEGLPFPSC